MTCQGAQRRERGSRDRHDEKVGKGYVRAGRLNPHVAKRRRRRQGRKTQEGGDSETSMGVEKDLEMRPKLGAEPRKAQRVQIQYTSTRGLLLSAALSLAPPGPSAGGGASLTEIRCRIFWISGDHISTYLCRPIGVPCPIEGKWNCHFWQKFLPLLSAPLPASTASTASTPRACRDCTKPSVRPVSPLSRLASEGGSQVRCQARYTWPGCSQPGRGPSIVCTYS